MPTTDYATLSFQQYQPHAEDLCSLCGANFGRSAMIEIRNNIHFCLRCVEVLAEIKNERETKKRDEVETAFRTCLAGTGAGITPLAAKCLYDAIAAGKIPGIRIE